MTQPAPVSSPRRSRRIVLIVAALVLLLAIFVGIPAAAALVLTRPERKLCDETPGMFKLAFEDVRFPARSDGIQIAGWFIPREGSDRALIMVHGKDGSRTREYHHHFIDLASDFHKRGYAVLMIDLRGHGASDDARYTFGIRERWDVEGAVDWLLGHGFSAGRIGVLGVSMGGASTMYAAAEEPKIGAVVVDSTFAEIMSIVEKQWSRVSGLPQFFLPLTIAIGRPLVDFDIGASKPIEVVSKIAPRPFLVIHGRKDHIIPPDHAERLKAAVPGAELWMVDAADHAEIYNLDSAVYFDRVAGFFDRGLVSAAASAMPVEAAAASAMPVEVPAAPFVPAAAPAAP